MRKGGERSVGGKFIDLKEGLYMGAEDPPDHPNVLAKLPTFGRNVFPDKLMPEMRALMTCYHNAMTELGNSMMRILALGLDLEADYLLQNITCNNPVVLPRMFRYPRVTEEKNCLSKDKGDTQWGIGRHSDYGLWTMIITDAPGLGVFSDNDHVSLLTLGIFLY
jgi:polar amino acid transport system ATP-binding protein